MSLNYIIFRNLRKNLKNYYLYVFALIFSVALYFSFVTLQYDPSMDEVAESTKGAAAIGASSVLLIVIVGIFLLYANTIFIKRRSKEIGLFQLIGLTKGRIFGILSAENCILYFGSMVIGILIGFLGSKLILMILFKIIGVDVITKLYFSPMALVQTLIVFAVMYLLIMLMNYTFIRAQSILSLFRVSSTTEQQVKKLSVGQILMGILGIALIVFGYILSARLFSVEKLDMQQLMYTMILILFSVILGTYLFYKGSVSFIFNMIRKSKKGYLSINEVLSLSSIMFRMKSNALLLTIITTVSALAIGMLSLSYISYYSAEAQAKESLPEDFSFAQVDVKNRFVAELDNKQIPYEEKHRQPLYIEIDAHKVMNDSTMEDLLFSSVVSDSMVDNIDLKPGEVVFMGYGNVIQQFFSIREEGPIVLHGLKKTIDQQLIGTSKQGVLPVYYNKGTPVAVVDESVYAELAQDLDPKIQEVERTDYYGVQITDSSQDENAYAIFADLKLEAPSFSQIEFRNNQRTSMGLIMFIVGFLGLTFLITSGCILYFKQMNESEEEKSNYTILRKLGFTQGNLLRGIQYKQLFNFGIPLVVGLSHSYFAVKSGWFFFGTELATPTVIVMIVYTLLYSIFGLLSIWYYKRVIKESL
ncbi:MULTISPECIES: ABC transporter permease [Paenibacillus]|uniref:FtsX-like permease family protein n=2 Tax=Paenibacillus TaxID=44249 RepID=A0A855XVA3_9BACL|nr:MULTISPECIES: ABC transporter permease [Paenibacillus]PWW40838.1 FtsX-like permease family protein [Paenibacillus pabuli]PXW11962.1 FtsX-like permease family protein [Paenibacillus taichungensis]RAI97324.1 FtsX-like permease family protein [Paenibacillus pabuli]